jgi:hypothetical protein
LSQLCTILVESSKWTLGINLNIFAYKHKLPQAI